MIAPCSNGHIAQSVNLAKYAGLPWDAILGAEIARAYKPDPRSTSRASTRSASSRPTSAWSPPTTATSSPPRRSGCARRSCRARRARSGPDDRPHARGRLRRRGHRFLAARGPVLGPIIASRGSRVDAGYAPGAAARHRRRARAPVARRPPGRAAGSDDRDPALGHGRVPAARRGRRRAGGAAAKGSRRRSSRASVSRSARIRGPDRGRAAARC